MNRKGIKPAKESKKLSKNDSLHPKGYAGKFIENSCKSKRKNLTAKEAKKHLEKICKAEKDPRFKLLEKAFKEMGFEIKWVDCAYKNGDS